MKFLLTAFFLIIFVTVAFAQTQTQSYRHHFWGVVLDENDRPLAGLLVCWMPLGIPLSEPLLSCTRTDENGEYALTAKIATNKLNYSVVATTGKSVLKWDRKTKRVSSEPLEFADADDCRQIDLRFKSADE